MNRHSPAIERVLINTAGEAHSEWLENDGCRRCFSHDGRFGICRALRSPWVPFRPAEPITYHGVTLEMVPWDCGPTDDIIEDESEADGMEEPRTGSAGCTPAGGSQHVAGPRRFVDIGEVDSSPRCRGPPSPPSRLNTIWDFSIVRYVAGGQFLGEIAARDFFSDTPYVIRDIGIPKEEEEETEETASVLYIIRRSMRWTLVGHFSKSYSHNSNHGSHKSLMHTTFQRPTTEIIKCPTKSTVRSNTRS